MFQHTRAQRGQALILVVFGMVALIGVTALAIDGGNAYSDRRHAQNAADTGVLAAGLTKVRNPASCWDPTGTTLCTLARDAGLSRAQENGFDNNGTSNIVSVYECSDAAASCLLPVGEDPHDFVQVTITSTVPTFFARVVGMPAITNYVQAVARAAPPAPTPWYNGNALVATMPGCHPPAPHDAFTVSGNSVTLVTGAGGVFVNSECSNAFTSNGGTQLDSVSGVCVVGGVVDNGGVMNPPPDDYCSTQIDDDLYTLPSVGPGSCPNPGQYFDIGGGMYVATPGSYDTPFPDLSPAGTLKLQKGIYCLNDGITVNAGWTITTDLDGNGVFDGSDGGEEGVLFYVHSGSVTFNGGSFMQLGAINKPGTDPGIKGYLIYLPPTNSSTVKIAGSNGSTFIGTILAPASHITLEGGAAGDHLTLECQIIGYSVEVTGNGTLDVEYNQGKNGQTYTNPELALYK
jgi:hypothetical protein